MTEQRVKHRCTAINHDTKQRCNAGIWHGSDKFCIHHDPARKATRIASASKAGKARAGRKKGVAPEAQFTAGLMGLVRVVVRQELRAFLSTLGGEK